MGAAEAEAERAGEGACGADPQGGVVAGVIDPQPASGRWSSPGSPASLRLVSHGRVRWRELAQ